jgi:hypothetical protein
LHRNDADTLLNTCCSGHEYNLAWAHNVYEDEPGVGFYQTPLYARYFASNAWQHSRFIKWVKMRTGTCVADTCTIMISRYLHDYG